jgi:hypothetical protein
MPRKPKVAYARPPAYKYQSIDATGINFSYHPVISLPPMSKKYYFEVSPDEPSQQDEAISTEPPSESEVVDSTPPVEGELSICPFMA